MALKQETLFTVLTRRQMFTGVSYSWFVITVVIAVDRFQMLRSAVVLLATLVVHLFGMIVSLCELRIVDLWLIHMRNSPHAHNVAL